MLKDATGQPISFAGPHIKVEELVAHIPASAYRAVTVGEQTYWCFTMTARLPSLGKVRLVISFSTAELTGTFVVFGADTGRTATGCSVIPPTFFCSPSSARSRPRYGSMLHRCP